MIGFLPWLLSGFWRKRLLLLTLDLAGASFAFLLSYLLSTCCFSVGARISDYTPILVIFTFFLITSMYFLDGYKPVEDRRSERELEMPYVQGIYRYEPIL